MAQRPKPSVPRPSPSTPQPSPSTLRPPPLVSQPLYPTLRPLPLPPRVSGKSSTSISVGRSPGSKGPIVPATGSLERVLRPSGSWTTWRGPTDGSTRDPTAGAVQAASRGRSETTNVITHHPPKTPSDFIQDKDQDQDQSQVQAQSAVNSTGNSLYFDETTKTFYPSTAIREITSSYLSKALENPEAMTTPQRLLVILDLNGMLFYRHKYDPRMVTLRPHLQQFLDYVFARCQVMVWSSAQLHNVDKMLGLGFGHRISKLDRVWTRRDLRLSPEDYGKKVLTVKDLQFVWDKIAQEISASTTAAGAGAPARGGSGGFDGRTAKVAYDQTNTVLIDDSAAKIQLQPYNGLVLRSFTEEIQLAGADDELKRVQGYLEKLRYQKNVSAYMRLSPYPSDGPCSEDSQNVETEQTILATGIAKCTVLEQHPDRANI